VSPGNEAPSANVDVDVDVVIVNFNAGQALSRCVRSVMAQGVPLRLVVIDNASSDGSARELRREFEQSRSLTLVENAGNPGFARAVNQAVRELENSPGKSEMEADYLLILNPDCEMRDGSLSSLIAALDENPGAGLAAPLVVDANGLPMRGALRRFPNPRRSLMTFSGLWRLADRYPALEGVEQGDSIPDVTVRAEAVSGACMLVRKSAFRELGGMDENYGLHCEDLDLMYRLRRSGAHCLLVPAARVYHRQGVSSRSRPLWAHWQKHRGMQRFFNKFQAANYVFPITWLVRAGIWIRFILTAPIALMRR
jgi:GT2 family glycosyltransferase